MSKEEDKSLIPKISECVIQIAMNAYNEAETSTYQSVWPDLVQYTSSLISLAVEPTAIPKIECGLKLFQGIYGFIYELILKEISITKLLERMHLLMKSNNLSLASKAIMTISEMSFYARLS